MKKQFLFIAFSLILSCGFIQDRGVKKYISVSENGRFLKTREGKPFIYIGDTAWELFHKLNREEATEYLENRAAKGFTVIQAVVLAENNGLRIPNSYGEVPLTDFDPTKPNEKYFEHVDFIVKKANELGLVIGMLPTWGDKVYSVNPGAGPIVFNKENAYVFGKYLGKRYKDSKIVWILGGDRNVANEEVFSIWNSMAKGLKDGDNGNHLMTYHPRGASNSAYFFHNSDWLDFNMYQSGHEGHFHNVYDYAEKSYLYYPSKPFVDGEPPYEDISIRFWDFMDFSKNSENRVPKGVLDDNNLIKNREHFKLGFIDAYDVRVHAYWNFLSGAAGYTYGNNAIWQMFKKGGEVAIPALFDWRESMDRPGAADMRHVRDIFESRPFNLLVPDQSIVYGVNRDGENTIRAAGSTDQSYLLVYMAKGQPVDIVMDKINDKNAVAWWYDTRNGEARKIGEFSTKGIKSFSPPSSGKNNDWLLVVDAISKNYPQPGFFEKAPN